MSLHTEVNIAAAITVMTSSTLTIASGLAIGNPTITTTGIIAYTILAALGTAISLAGVTAWLRTHTGKPSDYADNFKNDVVLTTAGVFKYVADTFFTTIIDSIAKGIGGRLQDRFRRYGK